MQGFNMGRYRPPSSLDPALTTSKTSTSTQKRHALGGRASKSHLGILTVRFEMPFAIWCSTCPSSSTSCLIGQGVRFNAEKKRVGAYFSTTIWSFRMKHTACGGWIEIRTDPKNSEYVVTEGARRRDMGDEATIAAREGALILATGPGAMDEVEKKRQDAFAALEGKVTDKKDAKNAAMRIEELKSLKERDWRDVDAANKKLRTAFREGRKVREVNALATEALQERMGLGIELLEENEDDRQRAKFTEFGASVNELEGSNISETAISKPLFSSDSENTKSANDTLAKDLQKKLSRNTRAVLDPFSIRVARVSKPLIPGLKRKRPKDASVS